MQYRGRKSSQRMTDQERGRGLVFLALYVLVFPFVMGLISRTAEEQLPVAEANVAYYLLMAVAVVLLFWSYLKNSFFLLLDRLWENLFAVVTGLGIVLVLQLAVHLVPFPVENPNVESYPIQYALSPSATVAIVVALMPIVEETLFRGLLFGSLRQISRPLAWALSTVVYCFYCSWQFALSSEGVDIRYLLLSFQYLPAALGLTWCYDRGGSVWAAVLLRMLVGGVFLFVLVSRHTL